MRMSKTFALSALVALAVSLSAPGAVRAQDADAAFDALRREPATLFDVGIIYLRQRIDREVMRYLIRSEINSANGVVYPDAKAGTILIEVTLTGPTAPCREVRQHLLEKFLNLDGATDQAAAAAAVMDNAFTHRGVDVGSEPSQIGRAMADRTVFAVRTLNERCAGPLAG